MDQLSPSPIAALRDRLRILSQFLVLSHDERALWLASQFTVEEGSIQEWTVRSGLSSAQIDDYLQHRLVAATWIDGLETERKTLQQALYEWTDELNQHLGAQGLNIREESCDDVIERITSKDAELPKVDYDDMERWYLNLRAIMDTFDHINLPPVLQPPAYYERENECPPDPSFQVSQATSRGGRKQNAPTIRLLYEASLQAVSSAASHMTQDVKRMKELATRVKIWGMDLFTGLLPLDELLNPNREDGMKTAKDSNLLRHNIVGIWADVAATLEHLLRCLIWQENSRLQSSWNFLLIALSMDEVANAVFDEPELLSEQPTTPIYDVDIIELCICRLEGFLDCLFDMLVNIGTLRQIGLSNRQDELSSGYPNIPTISVHQQGVPVVRTTSPNEAQTFPVNGSCTKTTLKTPSSDEKYPLVDPATPPSDQSTGSMESDLKEHLRAVNYQAAQPTIRDWSEKSKEGNWSKTSGSWVFRENEAIPWHSAPTEDNRILDLPSLNSKQGLKHPHPSPESTHEAIRPTPDQV